MFAFITIFISLIVLSLIMFSTKVQRKTRKTVSDYWNNYSWETIDERPKCPRWLIMLNYVVSLIPIANLLYTTFAVIWLIKQYNDGPWYNDGGNLIAERIIFSNKFTDWLTKEV